MVEMVYVARMETQPCRVAESRHSLRRVAAILHQVGESPYVSLMLLFLGW